LDQLSLVEGHANFLSTKRASAEPGLVSSKIRRRQQVDWKTQSCWNFAVMLSDAYMCSRVLSDRPKWPGISYHSTPNKNAAHVSSVRTTVSKEANYPGLHGHDSRKRGSGCKLMQPASTSAHQLRSHKHGPKQSQVISRPKLMDAVRFANICYIFCNLYFLQSLRGPEACKPAMHQPAMARNVSFLSQCRRVQVSVSHSNQDSETVYYIIVSTILNSI
jgi:hypothetical protein